ncbi:MAG: hypothetical protein WAU52_13640 [Burkholderiales bacterium]
MESGDFDVLLGLVKDLDRELDKFLSGSASASDAIPLILDTCKQMRSNELSDAVKYWLAAIEHHAAEITSPPRRADEDYRFLTSSAFLGTQLLKDIYFLRTGLVNARSSIH